MKKTLAFIMILTATVIPLAAQGDPAAPQPEFIGVSTAQMALREISLNRFEDDGFWSGYIPRDDGFIALRRFEGSPAAKRPLEAVTIPPIGGETNQNGAGFEVPAAVLEQPDVYVLGVKVTHIRRSVTYYSIRPVRPIPVPGIAKVLSIQVIGRNLRHRLYINVRDHFGNRARIYMGLLTHSGWGELKGTIPPHIRQQHPRYLHKQGIQVTEILIEPDPVETFGNFFVYFDDLRVTTDLFAEGQRDLDDIADNW